MFYLKRVLLVNCERRCLLSSGKSSDESAEHRLILLVVYVRLEGGKSFRIFNESAIRRDVSRTTST